MENKSVLSVLRDREVSRSEFRIASNEMAKSLATRAKAELPENPEVVLVPILRAGLSFLPSFLEVFESAAVGFIGLKRDEETFEPYEYYRNLPEQKEGQIIVILDPMLATGGSADKAMEILKAHGAPESNIYLVSCLGVPEGISRIENKYPEAKVLLDTLDEGLDKNSFIVPGLGDYGDRFFGTE